MTNLLIQDSAPMTIAILSRFSPPALSFLKSCQQKNIKTVFLWIGSPSEPAPASLFIQHLHRFPEALVLKEEGIGMIGSILGRYNNVSLYTINESMAKWLASNKRELGPAIQLMLQEQKAIDNILSKQQQADAATKAGLSLLKTYYLTGDAESLASIRERDYPLCIRPSSPGAVSPSFKVEILPDRRSLENFMTGRRYSGKGIMAQPFLNVPNLVVHGSRRGDGQTLGLQGFLVEKKFEGLTLTIRPLDLPRPFLSKCIRFTEIMGIIGPYHFEFLYDTEKNTSWFLEINARLGGTTAKVYALGYDEPGFLLQAFDHPVAITDQICNRTAASKLALLKYLVHLLQGKTTILDFSIHKKNYQKILATITGLLFYKDDILSMKDFQGAKYLYLDSIRGSLR